MPSKIVLINISGEDQPGLMAIVTSRLSDYEAHILDVGQSVIHNELNLGILIQTSETKKRRGTDELLPILKEQMEKLGMSIRATPVTEKQYRDWVAAQGKLRSIVTLLTSGDTSEQLASVTSVVQQQGLNVDGIRRLSGRITLGQESIGRIIVEMS